LGFLAQREDHAKSIALHMYYESHFRRTYLKRREFKTVIGKLFKFKGVSLLPTSNLRMVVYITQK